MFYPLRSFSLSSLHLLLIVFGGTALAAAESDLTVPAVYRPFYDVFSADNFESALRALPIKEISLSRSGCYGTCPVYDVAFRNDLSASFTAKRFIEPIGVSTGRIYPMVYGRLCHLIEDIGFASFKPQYNARWTDDETITITVVYADGRKTSVSDYGHVGPVQLWGLITVIEQIRSNIKWTLTESGAGEPKAPPK